MDLNKDLESSFNLYFWIASLTSFALISFGYATWSGQVVVYGIIGVCIAIPMKFVAFTIKRKLDKEVKDLV